MREREDERWRERRKERMREREVETEGEREAEREGGRERDIQVSVRPSSNSFRSPRTVLLDR